jgi:hypothetical protein
MRLRDFLLLGLAAAAILNSQGAFARDGGKVYRLGILSPAAGPVLRIRATALPELARLGFTEGHNLVVEARVLRAFVRRHPLQSAVSFIRGPRNETAPAYSTKHEILD